MRFCILGSGAWGTAMAVHIDRVGQPITLVPRRQEHALIMQAQKENKDYLPTIPLSATLEIQSDYKQAILKSDIVLLACPSQALRGLCEKIKELDTSHIRLFLTLCKGLEQNTLLKPVEVVESVISGACCGVLAGPSYAKEVALGKPTALTLGVRDAHIARLVQEAISNETFRIYHSEDVVGVELGSCLKNIYAIGAGISDGLQLGDNAKAAYLSRALSEMVIIGTHLGGQKNTFYGLSGFGDLVATCQGEWSRNRTFGEELVKTSSIESLLSNRKTVVEGYWATQCFYTLCQKYALTTPILEEVYKVLYTNQAPIKAIHNLMLRPLVQEKT